MKKLIILIVIIALCTYSKTYAAPCNPGASLCAAGLSGLDIPVSLVYNPDDGSLSISFLASDLDTYEPEEETYFSGQSSLTFSQAFQFSDDMNKALASNNNATINFGVRPPGYSFNSTDMIIGAGVAYPLSFDGTYYTLTVQLFDSSSYDSSGGGRLAPPVISNTRSPASIKVLPNPAANNIKLVSSFGSADNASYQVIDIAGRKLLGSSISNQTEDIDISSLAKGIYLINVYKNGICQQTLKFVRE